jgi:hypothetical protein
MLEKATRTPGRVRARGWDEGHGVGPQHTTVPPWEGLGSPYPSSGLLRYPGHLHTRERLRSRVQQNRDGIGAIIRHSEIQAAVAVDIAHRHRGRIPAGQEVLRGVKRAIAVPDQHADAGIVKLIDEPSRPVQDVAYSRHEHTSDYQPV